MRFRSEFTGDIDPGSALSLAVAAVPGAVRASHPLWSPQVAILDPDLHLHTVSLCDASLPLLPVSFVTVTR